MAFSQASITDLTFLPDGGDTLVAWRSTATAGTIFQVYVDLVLAWHGTERSVVLPLAGTHRIDVGTVAAGEDRTDFSASLAVVSATKTRVELAWNGGQWEATTLPVAGFHVYGPTAAGGAISYTAPLATVLVDTQGVSGGGWGMGGWGMGGWGAGNSAYTWISGRLCPGVWAFGVKPFDIAGNEGTALTASQTVLAAPLPPAANPAGLRLTYNTYHLVAGQAYATLHWLASPACV